jgi:hypothetical protein
MKNITSVFERIMRHEAKDFTFLNFRDRYNTISNITNIIAIFGLTGTILTKYTL